MDDVGRGILALRDERRDGSGVADSELMLVLNQTNQVIQMTAPDEDGSYALEYEHKGKSAWFTVILAEYGLEQEVELTENGWTEVRFDVDTGAIEATSGAGGKSLSP